jgi:tetratricopeptide (TPR) repeat protein
MCEGETMKIPYFAVGTAFRRGRTVSVLCLVLMVAGGGEANSKADAHFQKGLRLSLQKKWSQAEAEYRKALALDPKNASYHSYLADTLAAQGRFEKAQDAYQQSEKLPKYTPRAAPEKTVQRPPAAHAPSVPLSKTGDSAPANHQDDSEVTVTLIMPDGRTVVIGREGGTLAIPPVGSENGGANGMNHSSNDNADIAHDPHYLNGLEYSDAGNWAQVVTELLAALKKYPRSTEGWDALGNAYFKQERWKEAENAHRTAVRLAPEDAYLHAQLAHDLLKQNQRAEATREAREARRLGLEDHAVFDELE